MHLYHDFHLVSRRNEALFRVHTEPRFAYRFLLLLLIILLVHAGHYRNGLGMAPATARELRERLFPETAGAPGPGEAILTGA